MIATEFVAELEAVRDSFNWKLVADRSWHPERRYPQRLRIRGTLKVGMDGFVFEPIAAVCFIRTGRAFADDHWLESATAIDLSLMDAGDLIAAANDLTWVEVGGQRQPHPYKSLLRGKLTLALLLVEAQKAS
jgi:hypothetical protein